MELTSPQKLLGKGTRSLMSVLVSVLYRMEGASDRKMSQELLLGPATKKNPRKMSRYLRVEQQHP